MNEQSSTHSPRPEERAESLPYWTVFLAAAIFYVCFFSHPDALGLVGPDEPRYAAVAREMAERGDWVTPHLNGRPWFEKPILYYWTAALLFRVLGVNEFAARLPSALAAALAALILAWAGLRYYGWATARAVLLIFSTSVGTIGFARAATSDMLFTTALAAAMLAAYVVIENARGPSAVGGLGSRRDAFTARVAFGVFLGVATLAKGPAAIVLAGGSAGLWALATRRLREAFRLAHPLAIVSFCLIALPWYVLCAARNPGFLRTFVLAHNVERYLTPVFRHEQPFWFFGPVLLLGLFPWAPLLGAVAHDAVRLWQQRRWTDSPGFFFAAWAIFPVVFFSFSKSKLPGYMLPVIPPLALLMARVFTRASEEKPSLARWLMVSIGATFVALAASVGYWLRRLPAESGLADLRWWSPWIALAIAGGIGVASLGLRHRPLAALLVTAILAAGLVESANRQVLPRLDPFLSPRTQARAALVRPEVRENVSVYRLHRAWHYGLNFYLQRELPEWTTTAAPSGSVYTSAEGLAELIRQGTQFAIVEHSSPRVWLVQILSSP